MQFYLKKKQKSRKNSQPSRTFPVSRYIAADNRPGFHMGTGTDRNAWCYDRILPDHASLAKDDPPGRFLLYAGEDRFANEPDPRPNLHIVLDPRKLRDPDILADGHVIPHYHIHVNTGAVT
jgi:hypothetical protein